MPSDPEETPDSASHDTEYGLVMPFVVVKSKGGTYDDEAYCAGFEAGRLDVRFDMDCLAWLEETVRTANLDQLDLIAMNRGYLMKRGDGDDEWTHVTFDHVGGIAGPGTGG